MVVNRNLLSPNKFKIVIHKFPGLSLFAQRVAVPGATLGTVPRFTNTNYDVWEPGDKILFDDLIISAIVDEDLVGYNELKTWLYEVAISENKAEQFSDMDCVLGTNNSNPNKIIRFYNTFPYMVPSLLMDATASEDTQHVLDVIFKLTHFDIIDVE